MTWLNRTHLGDCRTTMRLMIAAGVKVDCVVTSPPYWGLRDYGIAGAFGLERTWIRHVARMHHVFRLVRDLMEPDAVLWLNYGDSYYTPRPSGSVGYNSTINGKRSQEEFRKASRMRKTIPVTDGPNRRRQIGFKPKDMVGMPWRIAFALQEDGWWLRSDIIWHKPNPMPESVLDRPTKSHEYVFLLAKSEVYHYDAQAIREPVTGDAHRRGNGVNRKAVKRVAGWQDGPGGHSPLEHAKTDKDQARTDQGLKDSTKFGRGAGWRAEKKARAARALSRQNDSFSAAVTELVDDRNVRTVWTVPTQAFEGAHFATFPEELAARCILAGSKPGDVIFDPFHGSGTVGRVATSLGRRFIGIELNPEYLAMCEQRTNTTMGMHL